MKIGIIGLPGSGKTTLFNALTGSSAELQSGKKDANISIVAVPDDRLGVLTGMYNPKKTVHAQIQFVDPQGNISSEDARAGGKGAATEEVLRLLRPADALAVVVRNFESLGSVPSPQADFDTLESEMILTDLISIEKRLERLEKECNKGKKDGLVELELLREAKAALDAGKALRTFPHIVNAQVLKGFTFLSAKPCITVINSGDDEEMNRLTLMLPEGVSSVEVKARLEMELSQLEPDEAEVFRSEMGLKESATQELIRASYSLLGLISFFTVGEDEVRAWNITNGMNAQKSAGAVHSDIEKGFIRAEVVAYDDLIAAKSYQAAQKAGKVRLEGKEYIVRDGDIINFRFNV